MQKLHPRSTAGFVVEQRRELAIVSVIARIGKRAALSRRVLERFGIELPSGPKRSTDGGLAWAGIRGDCWIVTKEHADYGLCLSLSEGLTDLATVVEQSDGLEILRLAGPKIRDALSRMVPVDVHPRVFKVGDVATTIAAQIRVTLWRLDDLVDGAGAFEVVVPRSFMASFLRALSHAVAH